MDRKSAQRIKEVEKTALKILQQNPGLIVQYRLLRDVLQAPINNRGLAKTRKSLNLSFCIQELEKEQRRNGGWGAFHSRSTKLKQKIPSTEFGVERALALGLDVSHPLLQKASSYILDIMRGTIPFPDYHEKNDRWQTGMRLFLSSTLSLIHPRHPLLNKDRRLWYEILKKTFRSGSYKEQDEIDAHLELTKVTVKDSYLVINNKYQLNILGSIPGIIPQKLELSLLKWLWEGPNGIGYLGIPLYQQPPIKSGPFDRWLNSLELLSRLFPAWIQFAKPSIEWLWEKRDNKGYWDFGPRSISSSVLPLSDNWRSRTDREFDWTTRILILLKKYYNSKR